MVIKLKPDFKYEDERGTICQILSIPNSQVNYLFTKKGAKRGRHYHKKNREYFYIITGKIAVLACSSNDSCMEKLLFESGDLFVIEPYVIHDFTFLEDTQMVVIYDFGVENGSEKDIYMEVQHGEER